MDVQQLNKDLANLLDKKIQLNDLPYDDVNYDQIEEEIHDLEDDILGKYGNYLEEAIYSIHDEFCPDSEVLLPIAYLPKRILKEGEEYKVDFDQGVYVAADDFESNETKLVLLANPLRLELMINPERKDIVWKP